ncbi:hypothetical protein KAF44_28860 (plasmid) [Cupriavidus necator]|nr:hypothetical protein KAF44_28860 [Cupriavidus necator]
MEAKHVANALNALFEVADADEASAAALALADRLISEAEGDARLRQSMGARAVASTLHALSRWPQESGLHEGAWCLAARLGWAPLEWSAFEFSQTGQIANALARLGRDEDGNAVLARDVLMGVAVHLELYPERFDSAEGRTWVCCSRLSPSCDARRAAAARNAGAGACHDAVSRRTLIATSVRTRRAANSHSYAPSPVVTWQAVKIAPAVVIGSGG